MAEKLAALNAGDKLAFFGNALPKCPHCGTDLDIGKNDWWHLYAEDRHEVMCPVCDNDFTVNTHARYTFSTDEQEPTNG